MPQMWDKNATNPTIKWPTWSWGGKQKRNADKAAPQPSVEPFTVPNPERGSPYIPANYDYAQNPYSPNYLSPTHQEADWRDRKDVPDGSRPSAKRPPQDWSGYERVGDYGRSIEGEHNVNSREGLPLYQRRYQSALNPYWYRIPDTRIQRAPHEYDFERKFDQGVLGERQLNGMHYSEATIGLTTSPSESLKGMRPPQHRRSTFRLEPTEWGENTVTQAERIGPPSRVFTQPSAYTAYNSSYRLD